MDAHLQKPGGHRVWSAASLWGAGWFAITFRCRVGANRLLERCGRPGGPVGEEFGLTSLAQGYTGQVQDGCDCGGAHDLRQRNTVGNPTVPRRSWRWMAALRSFGCVSHGLQHPTVSPDLWHLAGGNGQGTPQALCKNLPPDAPASIIAAARKWVATWVLSFILKRCDVLALKCKRVLSIGVTFLRSFHTLRLPGFSSPIALLDLCSPLSM